MATRQAAGQGVLKLMLDTNVLMDYCIRRTAAYAACSELIGLASASERVMLYVTALSLKDVYYLIQLYLKREARAQGPLTDSLAGAARETAWECVRHLVELVQVVDVGTDEVYGAYALRRLHADFEDDLLLAAALQADVERIVTSDGQLAAHAPLACVGIEEALALVRERVG